MIWIEQCINSCKKIRMEPYGECPIYKKIQEGMLIISKAMLSAHPDHKKLAGVVSEGHWLADCKFECRHFEEERH